MSIFDNIDDATNEAFRYKKRANRLRKKVVLLKAKITELEEEKKGPEERIDIIKQGVLELSDNLDNTEYSGGEATQEHDKQQWQGERIMNERVLKLIDKTLKG